ncbi:hypothetical protein HYFRA_00002474 [Hymenoscyphus fraxineus]|uniref:DUF6594 domain-containing protein n=1 Tax=Hymenoscyphus fraxineus TaxID=746836 RepID=A0A9N9PV44_9HELO|nr:hypothetical protein HYFRA_00002474 [Hymenoscyphus fraxineus]
MERDGHAKVAGLISRYPELAIMRRFGDLNMENLLYLQAELVHLESEYRTLATDGRGHPDRLISAKDWASLAYSEDKNDLTQWKKMLEIRQRLKEYSMTSQPLSRTNFQGRKLIFKADEAFAQVAFMTSMKSPNPYDLQFFRSWLERPKMGNFPILGPDQYVWDVGNEADLVAIQRRKGEDFLTRWFIDKVIPSFHRCLGKYFKAAIPEEPESEISHYSDSHLARFVHVFGVVLSSLLPISSIVILYFVSSLLTRLGIIATFTALFSLSLATVTQARRIEIFAGTSAFAAVQVVFVTANTNNMI